MRSAVALLGALALGAQTPHDPVEAMSRARADLVDTLRRMPNYTCVETVDRRYYRQAHPRGTCQDTLEYKRSGFLPRQLTATDRLRLDVAFTEQGREIYSWAGAGQFDTRPIGEIVGGGPIGTGAFGPFLLGIFGTPDVRLVYEGRETLNAKEGFIYRYRVPAELSHYELTAAGRRRIIAYDGTVRLDPESMSLTELRVHTGGLASDLGICDATTTVEFAPQRIGLREYLLPVSSRLDGVSVGIETENLTSYASCREYRGESSIRFDNTANEAAPAGAPVTPEGKMLPKGLPVLLALEREIDSDLAAAGDLVEARVREPIVEKRSKQVLVPAGALVRGRIIRMEHHLGDAPSFQFALLFESLESGGATLPFAAQLDTKAGPLGQFTVSVSELGNSRAWSGTLQSSEFSIGRTLVFPTPEPRYVVPRGYLSRWVTSAK